jgi:hypothetical protein
MELITTSDTYLKPSAADSSTIGKEELAIAKRGKTFPIAAYREEGSHIVFTLDIEKIDPKTIHKSGKNTWYVWKGAIEDQSGFSMDNKPIDSSVSKPKDLGVSFLLPGNSVRTWSGQPVHDRKAPNITWGEVLHFTPSGNYRRPANASVVANLISISIKAQKICDHFGKSIIIRSGYRDPETNARVGGAPFSMHVQGKALDIAIPGRSPLELYRLLNDEWRGGLAYSNSMQFLHVDDRSGDARWIYPGG